MEIDLAERMNVSRTPIREAIRELATDGLVVIEPRRGAYVSDISIQNMLDIFEVREDLEGLAAGLAAQRITEEEKLALSKMHRLYEMAVEARDKEEIVEYDEKFHNFIVRCSRNNVLIELSRQVQELSMRFRYLYYDAEPYSNGFRRNTSMLWKQLLPVMRRRRAGKQKRISKT